MELAIPYQKLEISKLHIIPQTNGYLPFEYKDGDLTLHRSVILTPVIKVINYDEEKGRVEFEGDMTFISKMIALQDVLKSVIFSQQKLFLDENLSKDQIEMGFRVLSYGCKFTMYIPSFIKSSNYNKWTNKGIHVIDNSISEWRSERDIFKVGSEMRLAIKLGGVKIKKSPRGTNFFIDHQILNVWICNN
jgi:hypothetical protein